MRTNVSVLKSGEDIFDALKKVSLQRSRYAIVAFVRNSKPPAWFYQMSANFENMPFVVHVLTKPEYVADLQYSLFSGATEDSVFLTNGANAFKFHGDLVFANVEKWLRGKITELDREL